MLPPLGTYWNLWTRCRCLARCNPWVICHVLICIILCYALHNPSLFGCNVSYGQVQIWMIACELPMWNSVSYANSTKSVSQHVFFFVCVYVSCTVISGYKSLWIIWWSKNNAQETGDYFIACSLGASIMCHKHQAYIKAIALAHMQEASGQKCAVISDYRSETLQWRWPDLSF